MGDSHRFHGFPQIFVDLCGRMKVTQIWLSLRPPIFNSQMTQMSTGICNYEAMHIWGVTIGVVDRILINFNRTGGLFHSILYTKLFSLLLLALSCLGTKGVKAEKMSWNRIWTVLAVGFFLFFLNWWILLLPISYLGNATLYIFTMTAGYICLLMGGLWMSRLLKHNLMEDVFNNENESFMQETKLMENEYSVNLPTRFYYKMLDLFPTTSPSA